MPTFVPEDVLKILLAIVAGGLIGFEREFRDKAAGFRTLIFISVGSTLFTILSAYLAGDKDPGRIAANIVTGVGFLGAGVIMRESGRVTGLTTAAAIWLTAAVGMSIGGGEYLLAGLTTLIATLVLGVFPRIENWIGRLHEERTYEVVCPASDEQCEQLEASLREHGLQIQKRHAIKAGDEMRLSWHVSGSPSKHVRLIRAWLNNPSLKEFHF